MAPATTSPVKILTDLGYPVWEMDADDILKALVRVINSLDPNDGRIPILQDAVKEIRGASRAATPSKAQKITEKRTRIKASNFIPKAKPASKPKVSSVAMLPPAQDDNETIFAGLLNGLKNIASLLKNISTLLGVQFIFKRLLAARQRRKDALDAKKKRESELEGSDKKGLGDRVRKTITKPIVSFWDSLLNFFKNIILGSAVLGFYKWMQDPKNQETIKGISDWLSKNGEGVLKGILSILALGIGFRIYRLVSRVGKAVFKISKFASRLGKGILRTFGERFGSRTAGEASRRIGTELAGETVNRLVGRTATALVAAGMDPDAALRMAEKSVGKKPSLARIFARRYDSLIGLRDKGIRGIKSLGPAITGLKSNISTFGKSALKPINQLRNIKTLLNPNFAEFASRTQPPKPTSLPTNVFKEADTGLDLLSKGDPKLAKLITEGLKKTKLDPLKGIKKAPNILGQSSEMVLDAVPTNAFPKIGEKFLKEGGEKVATQGILKTGMKGFIRALPLLGTYLDTVAAVEEIQKGNFYAAGLFGIGAITSLIPGAQGISLGASLSGIAASAIEDSTKQGPDLSMNKKKKEVNVVVVPTKTGGGQTNQQTGTSEVTAVSSIDMQNFLVSLAGSQYNMKHSAIGV